MPQEPFTYTRTVTFGDCDAARVLYTPRAVDYGVEAVEAWFDQVVGVSWSELVKRHGLEATFRSMECDYLSPMVAGQVLRLGVRVVEAGDEQLELSALVEREPGEAVFWIRFLLGFTRVADRTPVPVPVSLREPIHQYWQRCGAGKPGGPPGRIRAPLGEMAGEVAAHQVQGVPFTRKQRVRYGECGLSGNIYLPKLIEGVVERVGEWYHSCLGIAWLNQCVSGNGVPFVNIRCDCLRPVSAGSTLTMLVRVPHLGRASIGYRVTGYGEDGAPCFVAHLAGCYIREEDDGSYQVLPFPDEMRGKILAYQQSC